MRGQVRADPIRFTQHDQSINGQSHQIPKLAAREIRRETLDRIFDESLDANPHASISYSAETEKMGASSVSQSPLGRPFLRCQSLPHVQTTQQNSRGW